MVVRESALDQFGPIVRFGRWAAALLTLGFITGCGQTDASGTFIAKSGNEVDYLHIVETPDKRITGELDTAVLQSNGQIQYQSMALAGAADGSTVSLSVKPLPFLAVTIPISGTLEADRLTLTGAMGGGRPVVIVFARSTADEYRSQLNALDIRSRQILAANAVAAAQAKAVQQEREFDAAANNAVAEANAKAAQQEQEFISAANQLVARMEQFDTSAGEVFDGLPAYQTRMKTITAAMDSYLARERQLTGNANAAAARGRISVAISQGMVATDQLLNQVRVLESQFQANAEPLKQTALTVSQNCSEAPTKSDSESSACKSLSDEMPAFTANFEKLQNALESWETDYSDAHNTQQRLVEESEAIE